MLIKSLALAAAMLSLSPAASAQEDDAEARAAAAADNVKPGSGGAEIVHLVPVHKPHWEYGFDLDGTIIHDKFTPYLAAQWNYIFKPFDTMVGVALGATAQTVRKTYAGGRSETALYTWGVDARQDFITSGDFTLGASFVAGSGVSYVRFKSDNLPSTIHGITILAIEPGIFGTFLSYKSLEIGATAGLRIVNVDSNIKEIKGSDLTSAVLGVTFRERRTM